MCLNLSGAYQGEPSARPLAVQHHDSWQYILALAGSERQNESAEIPNWENPMMIIGDNAW